LNDAELMKKWKAEEENFHLQGWDFSHLAGRWECPAPPWFYQAIIVSYLSDADLLLDMGTGGGEVLLTLEHPYDKTYATEAYEPNFQLCQNKLSPLGITMARTFADDKLPFADAFFDFIVNRHESFDLPEVKRVLKAGGYFFTQQVGNENFYELALALNGEPPSYHSFHKIEKYMDQLVRLGFQIIIKDEFKSMGKFFDIGAVIFYCKACAWNFPDFSVETHFDKLRKLHDEIEEKGFLQMSAHLFLLAARKK